MHACIRSPVLFFPLSWVRTGKADESQRGDMYVCRYAAALPPPTRSIYDEIIATCCTHVCGIRTEQLVMYVGREGKGHALRDETTHPTTFINRMLTLA